MAEHTLTKTVFNQEMDKLIDVVKQSGGGGGGGTGGGGAYIRVTTQEPDFYGLTVTFKLRNSNYTVEKKFNNSGFCEANVTEVGDYDVSLTHDGITYIVPVNVTFFGVYTASLNKFSAVISVNVRGGVDTTGETVTVTATHIESGAKFTQSGTGENIDVVVSKTGDYTIQANIGNGKSSTATANIDELGNPASATVKFAKITVSINSDQGANLTLSDGVSSYNIVKGPGEYTETKYVSLGNWTLSGTLDGAALNPPKVINVTEYKAYETGVSGGNAFSKWVQIEFPSISPKDCDELQEHQLAQLMSSKTAVDELVSMLQGDASLFSEYKFDTNEYAMRWIGKVDYTAHTLLAVVGQKIAESEYWELVLTDSVPKMTSNTEPEGTITSSSIYQTFYPWLAFDGDENTRWVANSNKAGEYIQYQFSNPICIKKIAFKPNSTTGCVASVKISKDGTDDSWTTLGNIEANGSDMQLAYFENNVEYVSFVRIECVSNASTYFGACILNFYGRALKRINPIMTSNTTPSGECFAENSYSETQQLPYNAFNKANFGDGLANTDNSNIWHSKISDNENTIASLGYEPSKPFAAKYIRLEPRNPNTSSGSAIPKHTIFQGYDGSKWNDIKEFTTSNKNEVIEGDIDNDIAYESYRFYFNKAYRFDGSGYAYNISAVFIYGIPAITAPIEELTIPKLKSYSGISTAYTSLDDLLNPSDETKEQAEKDIRQIMTVHKSAKLMVQHVYASETFRSKFTASRIGMKWLGLRDYACDMALGGLYDVTNALLASDHWEYILKDSVPKMTSNTAPEGTAYASNEDTASSSFAYHAFDGTTAYWRTSNLSNATSGKGVYIQYTFTKPINVKRFVMGERQNIADTEVNFNLYASNDGFVTKEDLGTYAFKPSILNYYDIQNDNFYLAYRVEAEGCNRINTRFQVLLSDLNFYGRALNESVPVMASNTEPIGEIGGGQNFYPSEPAWKAFDGNDETWASISPSAKEATLWYKFVKPIKVRAVRTVSNHPLDVIYSDDGKDWKLCNLSITKSGLYPINDFGEHIYWGVKRTSTTDVGGIVQTLQFYGVSYSEEEFAEGSNIEMLYDNGVEIHPFTTSANGSNIAEKLDDGIHFKRPSSGGAFAYSDAIDFSKYYAEIAEISLTDALVTNANYYGYVAASRTPSVSGYIGGIETKALPKWIYNFGNNINESAHGTVGVNSGNSSYSIEFTCKKIYLIKKGA